MHFKRLLTKTHSILSAAENRKNKPGAAISLLNANREMTIVVNRLSREIHGVCFIQEARIKDAISLNNHHSCLTIGVDDKLS